jgi:hypothetical protein
MHQYSDNARNYKQQPPAGEAEYYYVLTLARCLDGVVCFTGIGFAWNLSGHANLSSLALYLLKTAINEHQGALRLHDMQSFRKYVKFACNAHCLC